MTASEWKTFRKITRGFPELRKLREMMDLVYGLYDRRCRRVTALEKLRKLRERLKRFGWLSEVLKKLESPTIDRSLVFLDDKKLPSTSNAVERGNRRFRKMQKTVYRVRTCENIRQRMAMLLKMAVITEVVPTHHTTIVLMVLNFCPEQIRMCSSRQLFLSTSSVYKTREAPSACSAGLGQISPTPEHYPIRVSSTSPSLHPAGYSPPPKR